MVPFFFTDEKELIFGYRDYLPKTWVISLFPLRPASLSLLGAFTI